MAVRSSGNLSSTRFTLAVLGTSLAPLSVLRVKVVAWYQGPGPGLWLISVWTPSFLAALIGIDGIVVIVKFSRRKKQSLRILDLISLPVTRERFVVAFTSFDTRLISLFSFVYSTAAAKSVPLSFTSQVGCTCSPVLTCLGKRQTSPGARKSEIAQGFVARIRLQLLSYCLFLHQLIGSRALQCSLRLYSVHTILF